MGTYLEHDRSYLALAMVAYDRILVHLGTRGSL